MLSVVDLGPPPACPTRLNLAAHVLAAGAACPDKIALAVVGPARADRWSFARLSRAVGGAAAWFRAAHPAPGTRVLLRIGNSVDFPIVFLGAIAAGHVPVPTSAALTAGEITRIAADLDPALVVAGAGVALPEHPAPVVALADLRAEAGEADLRAADTGAEDAAYIVYTSGTSGAPRGVVHAHRAVWARRMMVEGWYGLTPEDRVMHAGAFNWTYTLGTGLLDPWAMGATALIPAEGISADALPLLIARHDVTIFAAVPGVFRRLLRQGPLPPMAKLRHGLSAGEKLPDEVRAHWRDRTGTDIHEAFGQSECSTFVSGSPARPAPEGSLGFPQPGRRMALLGEDGQPVGRGMPGILAVHRADPGLMLGYLHDPEAEARHLRGDWFLTGDSMVLRDDGALDYIGRADDLLTAGGFRVSPLEVEAALTAFPGVAEAAAVDHVLDRTTRVIAAFYVAEGPVDEAKLAAHCAERLASYKRPRVFFRVDGLPRAANGKLARRALRITPDTQSETTDDQA
ncbi:AMP-binding protein [Palleronia sp. KMU-117]|uniref:class I adenylate-forming enzyme family protein n=1 Tax=Palleronia sp. KMU-117 TaxID=3434108 RepID=UPI003D73FF79